MSWHAGPLGSETFVRSFNFLRYCLICSVSLFKAMVRCSILWCLCCETPLVFARRAITNRLLCIALHCCSGFISGSD